MTAELLIRAEEPGDRDAIDAVHVAAFGRPDEARLVDRLRESGQHAVSLVALAGGAVVGHILFSPVRIDGLGPQQPGAGLAPLAVVSAHRRRGIGGRLVEAGLAACRGGGYCAAVVLGDPGFYGRFGFVPAREFGLSSEYDAPEHFMAIELRPRALAGAKGMVRYAEAFREI